MNERPLARFQKSFFITERECWHWTAHKDKWGYGKFNLGKETFLAHRVSYEHFVGPIPDGLEIDHLCRNRLCVNPQHLEPVTKKVNILRGVSFCAINASKIHCQNGHEFTQQNTYIRPNGNRSCRQCSVDTAHKYRLRHSGKAVPA